MKKNLLSVGSLVALLLVTACNKKDITPAPNTTGNGVTIPTTPTTSTGPTVTVNAPITANTTWTANNKYLLKDFVYVRSGVTLTIEAGTIIKGDRTTKGTLIIEPGAKIIAIGTVDKPIVFTSNEPRGTRNPGDWGGVIIAGNAQVNTVVGTKLPQIEGGPTTTYGSSDASKNNDNSGTMQYVRIEFGGIAFSPDNEVNGLTLAGVGSGTTLDHIQVSYSGDDSFEWFGGAVNAKYLVSHRCFDDDFDTDNGFSGKVQFGVSLRDPQLADQSGSKAFESDNDSKATTNTPQTSAVFSNMTLVGPILNPTTPNYNAQYTAGAHIRRNSAQSILNSVFLGFPTTLLIDGSPTATNIANNNARFKNNILAGALANSNSTNGQRGIIYIGGQAGGTGSLTPNSVMGSDSSAWGATVGPLTWLKANDNRRYVTSDNVQLLSPFNLTTPSFLPRASSPIVFATAPATVMPVNFTDSKVTDAFFTKVSYVGAADPTSATNWLATWTNFDPQNTDY